jgi:uncharacterized protein
MTDEELEKFKQKLIETTSFPSVYMFKFIIRSNNRNIAMVENLFGSESNILTKESEKGKYTSVTAKQVVINVEEIIDIYKRASSIEGIIFL